MSLNKVLYAKDVEGLIKSPMNKTTKRIFVAATRQNDGKTTSSLGLLGALRSMNYRVGYIKPVAQRIVEIENGVEVDEDTFLINKVYDVGIPIEAMSPVAIDSTFTRRYLDNPGSLNERITDTICRAFDRVAYEKDIVIVEGSGHAGVGSVFEASNAQNAKCLNAKAIIVSSGGIGKPVDEIAMNKALFDKYGVECVGAILNKIIPDKISEITHYVRKGLANLGLPLLGVLPLTKSLLRPNLSQIVDEIDAEWLVPIYEDHDQRVQRVIIGAMSAQNVLRSIDQGSLVILPGDREDILFALVAAISSTESLSLSGLILTNGYAPNSRIISMFSHLRIPVASTNRECFSVTTKINGMTVKTQPKDKDKVVAIESIIKDNVDLNCLINSL